MAVTITITADAQDAIRTLQQLEGVMGDIGETAESASTQTSGGFASAIQGAGDFVFAARNVIGAVTGMADAVGDFADRGAEIQRAENALIAFSGGAEEAEAVLTSLRGATVGLVSDFDLMTSGARFMSMGIAESADEAAELAEIAVTLGSALGRGPNEAMEEFALLMANESIPRLDTFGIGAGRVRARINELLDSGQALNRSEAFRMAVIEDAVPKVEALGGAANIAGSNFERAKIAIENATNAIASAVATGVDEALGFIFDFISVLAEIPAAVVNVVESFADFLGIGEGLRDVGAAVGGFFADAFGGDAMTAAQRDLQTVRDELANLTTFTFEEPLRVDVMLADPELRELAKDLLAADLTPVEVAAVLADPELTDIITDLTDATDNLPPAEIIAQLEDPEFRAIVEAIRDFGNWGDAELGAAIRDGGLEEVNRQIEGFGDFEPAEIAAILASDGLDEVNTAISSGDYDPATTTVIVARQGLEPVQAAIDAEAFVAEAGINIPSEQLDEIQRDLDARTLAARARFTADTLAILRDDIEGVAEKPVFVGIVIDETEFVAQSARLSELDLDPVVVDAIIESARLVEIRQQLEGANVIDVDFTIRAQQINELIQDLRAEIGDSTVDVRVAADQQAFDTLIEGLRTDIGDEELITRLGFDAEDTRAGFDALVSEVGLTQTITTLAFAFDAQSAKDAVNELALTVGRDPLELQAEFQQIQIAQLAEQLDLPPVQVEAIFATGNLDNLIELIRQSGLSSIELELALSGETIADVQTRLSAEPLAASVFIDDQSIFDMRIAMEEAGVNVPANFTIEGVAETLQEAGFDELAIAAFVEEESIDAMRGQLEAVGVDDVIIDVILSGGATDQAQALADNLIAAANAAERMETASQGISEALGVADVTGLTSDIESAFAEIVGPEGEIELALALGTTTEAEVALDELLGTIETASLETEQEIELALALRAALETGQVNDELLNQINAAIEEGDFALAIDIAAEFTDVASAEVTGADLTLLAFQDADLIAQGWSGVADPPTTGADLTEETFMDIQSIVSETRYSNALADSEAILANAQATAVVLQGASIGGGNGTPQAPEQQGVFEP